MAWQKPILSTMNKGLTSTYGLTHIAVLVKDIERTLLFYQAVFDMDVMYHEKDMIQLTTPGCHDILVFQQGADDLTGKSGGIVHFGFRLRDPKEISLIKKKIINMGAVIKEEGEFVPGSPYIFFYDPDGYEVEVWYELTSWE
jgi:catechol 2,3-dioxygenase-like lactoylglutathione lyase family enzyme